MIVVRLTRAPTAASEERRHEAAHDRQAGYVEN
jgi:hypothetical protein